MNLNSNKFFTLDTEARNQFIQVPKQFMNKNSKYFKLNPISKLLYGMLADRNSLSIKNGWIDENKRIFFLFSQQSMSNLLGDIDPKTVRKYLRDLEDIGLLFRERQGRGNPDRLYLLQIDVEESLYDNDDIDKYTEIKMGKNSLSKTGKIPHLDREKFPPNKTNINKTNINKTENTSSSSEDEEEEKTLIENNIQSILRLCQSTNYKLNKTTITNLLTGFGFEKLYKAIAVASSTRAFSSGLIKNYAGYITKILNDQEKVSVTTLNVSSGEKKLKFSNYDQRDTDYDLIEDEFLEWDD